MLIWCLKLMRYNLYRKSKSLQYRKAGITSYQYYKSFDQLFDAGYIQNEAGWQDLTNFKRNAGKFSRYLSEVQKQKTFCPLLLQNIIGFLSISYTICLFGLLIIPYGGWSPLVVSRQLPTIFCFQIIQLNSYFMSFSRPLLYTLIFIF